MKNATRAVLTNIIKSRPIMDLPIRYYARNEMFQFSIKFLLKY